MRPRALFVVLLLLLGTTACDDDPFRVRWEASADTVTLYSLARPELNLPSAFNFVARAPVRIESPTVGDAWDVAVDTRNGAIVLLPPRVLGVASSRAGIARTTSATFEGLTRAPADSTAYTMDEAVPVEVGTIYAIQTRQVPGLYGTLCVYYGKFEPLALDPALGAFTFQYDVSPVCNDRRLIPPD